MDGGRDGWIDGWMINGWVNGWMHDRVSRWRLRGGTWISEGFLGSYVASGCVPTCARRQGG